MTDQGERAGRPGPWKSEDFLPEERETPEGPEAFRRLRAATPSAPADFLSGVMAALPERSEARTFPWFRFRPVGNRWRPPLLAGALAALLTAVVLSSLPVKQTNPDPGEAQVNVVFDFHAPEADRVELVGTFNDWRPGTILLEGPDGAGSWHATVRLPRGRHEYLFLIDGRTWAADPRAEAMRPDGFGRDNALLEL